MSVIDELCGTKCADGTVGPRNVIYHIARHVDADVQLSYIHYGSPEAAFTEILKLKRDNPDWELSTVKYVRA